MADSILCDREGLGRREAIDYANREAARLLRQVWVVGRGGTLLVLLPAGLRAGDTLVYTADVASCP